MKMKMNMTIKMKTDMDRPSSYIKDKVDSTESYDGIVAGDATASKNFKQLDLVMMDLSLLQS